jgi:hypothetical protein
MTALIKGRIVVKKWDVDPQKVAAALAQQPSIRGTLVALAQEVAEGTQKRMANASKPQKIVYEKYLGVRWSAEPTAVAKGIKYKDIIDETTAQGYTMPVALVIADHPYSVTYEKGHDEFPNTNAMAGALQASANRRPKALSRRPAAP